MTVTGYRVAKGAAWLDLQDPHWYQRIDLAKLDWLDPCVLDMVYPGGYVAVAHYLQSSSTPPTGWWARFRAWYRGQERSAAFTTAHGFLTTHPRVWKRAWIAEVERRIARARAVRDVRRAA